MIFSVSRMSFGHVREDRRAAHRQVDAAADREDVVANRLGVEPLRAIPPEQQVLRILLDVAAVIERRRHLIGLGGHHQPVELLEAPALVHELHGQPVEQFGMRRLLSHLAEVVERRDDAAAEVVTPTRG